MTQNDETSNDDVLAGEYVLGLLSLDVRRTVERRMETDPAFLQLVHRWESDLSAFNSAYDEIPPGDGVLRQIEARLFGVAQPSRVGTGLWNSMSFWRWWSFGTSIVAMCALFYASGMLPFPVGEREFVAELSAPTNTVNMLVSYNAGSGAMHIVPVAGGAREEKSLELWLLTAGGDPLSLGILPADLASGLVIPADFRDRIGEGATLAVTLEPFGGSPTGRATGPIIASGTARRL